MIKEPTKTCAKCSRELSLYDFYRRRDSPDGHQSWCKSCSRAKRAQWADENREHLRDLHRESHDRRTADPQRSAIERERKREWQRQRRRTRPENYRVGMPAKTVETLAPEPFATWIRKVLDRESQIGTTITDLAARFEISEKTIRDALNGRHRIDLTIVERALITEGVEMLDDLYPYR